MKKLTASITDIATTLNLSPVEKTLPNGKVVKSVEWAPSHLPAAFKATEEMRSDMGRGDVVTFDGGCPGWLLVCCAHAAHPADCAVRYPQGGPDAVLPITGTEMSGEGAAEGITFEVVENEEYTQVNFSLANPSIDLPAALASLVAPEIPAGKPVRISGRGPIGILASLASAYSHLVPEVACFQPSTGNVVAISHGGRPLGTVVE